jgi:hypothetical protein
MLNDKQRKKVIADYIETQNLRETARRNNITAPAVKDIIDKEPDTLQKLTQKKAENTQDVLQYMDTLFEKKRNVLKLSLDNMIEKLEQDKVSPTALATIYGVLLDKELKAKELYQKEKPIEANANVTIINDLPKDE